MSTEIRPAHSPLGASSAERWMNCAGSVALIQALGIQETTDEPDYRSLGTSAHSAIDQALKNGQEAWELINTKFGLHEVDEEMATAIQVFLDECNGIIAENPGGQVYIEYHIEAPEIHKDYFGRLDWGYVLGNKIWIRDYKHGEGIAVDVEWNPQIMYYAFGLIRNHPEVTEASLGIVQPRLPYGDGPVRLWDCPADTIRTWATQTLKAAMDRTALDHDLDAGKWCRFCPAKIVCPLMWSLFGAAMQTDPKQVVNLSDAALGRSYQYKDAVNMFLKAMEEEAFRRLNAGKELPNVKLVNKKANRVFKPGALEALSKAYGDKVYTEPQLKGPAEIEKMGPQAKELVKEWAYKPDTGLTVALASDKRPAILVRPIAEVFAGSPALKQGE